MSVGSSRSWGSVSGRKSRSGNLGERIDHKGPIREHFIRPIYAKLDSLKAATTRWLARWSITILRVGLGVIFLGFGLLKFFPGVSPAGGGGAGFEYALYDRKGEPEARRLTEPGTDRDATYYRPGRHAAPVTT